MSAAWTTHSESQSSREHREALEQVLSRVASSAVCTKRCREIALRRAFDAGGARHPIATTTHCTDIAIGLFALRRCQHCPHEGVAHELGYRDPSGAVEPAFNHLLAP